VYGQVTWVEKAPRPTLEVQILPRANGRPVCSGCGQPGPGYDRLPPRRFEFVPLRQIAVFFVYALRRVDCPRCGVKVEQVPWSDGKHTLTHSYRWFLAGWAQRLSWQQVAAVFYSTWDHVHAAVEYAVLWGLANRELKNVQSIGVDEVQWQRGHKYLTVTMSGSSHTDSYKSAAGAYSVATAGSRGHVCSDGPITMSGSTGINGNAYPGEGFTVSSSSSVGVLGTTEPRTEPLNLPAINPGIVTWFEPWATSTR
jgi:hypothetical protein